MKHAEDACWFPALLVISFLAATPALADDPAAPTPPTIDWFTDYYEACRAARSAEQMLLVVFYDPRHADTYNEYLQSLEKNAKFARTAQNFVLCKLPTDFRVKLTPTEQEEAAAAAKGQEAEHREIQLIQHAAFSEMHGRAGFAFIDYAHQKGRHFGRVVNIYPFKCAVPQR